ncbi:VP6 protein [Wanken orbivirus]|nr:VP6 protein [Wanken orbivirus]
MKRLAILAPGDILKSVAPELEERGIRLILKEVESERKDEKKGKKEDKDGRIDGKRGSDGGIDRPTQHTDGSEDRSKPTTNPTTTKDGGGNETGSGEKEKNLSSGGDGSLRQRDTGDRDRESEAVGAAGASGKADAGLGSIGHSSSSGAGDRTEQNVVAVSDVLSDRIFHRTGCRLRVMGEMDTGGPEVKILNPQKGLMKELGMNEQDRAEHTDRMMMVTKQNGKKRGITSKNVVSVSSLVVLKELLNVDHQESPSSHSSLKRSAITLATNDPAYALKAQFLFTSPTGDPTWKETARLAMQNKNIQAFPFVQDPNNEDTPQKALLALIDHI